MDPQGHPSNGWTREASVTPKWLAGASVFPVTNLRMSAKIESDGRDPAIAPSHGVPVTWSIWPGLLVSSELRCIGGGFPLPGDLMSEISVTVQSAARRQR